MKNSFLKSTGALSLALACFALSASADVVPVVNGGFDVTDQAGGSGPFTLGSDTASSQIYAQLGASPTDTLSFSYGGTASGPATGEVLGFTAIGDDISYVQYLGSNHVNPGDSSGFVVSVEGGSLSQTLTSDLLANSTYTLTFDAAHRSDQNDPGSAFTATLLAGTTVLATLTPSTTLQGLTTTFQAFTLNYTDIGVLNAPVGQALTISFNNTMSGSEQALVDNVSLNETSLPTPEPSTFALLGLGLLGLFFVARRWAALKG